MINAEDPTDVANLSVEALKIRHDAERAPPPPVTPRKAPAEPRRKAPAEPRPSAPAEPPRSSGAAKSSAPAGPPLKKQASDEDEKSALVDKIFKYREHFTQLKSRNKVSVTSPTAVLRDELRYYEQQLGSTATANPASLCFIGACHAAEVGVQQWNPLGLNLAGLGKVAEASIEKFEPLLMELTIKYGAAAAVGPELRLAFAFATMVATVHAANSGDPQVTQMLGRVGGVINSDGPLKKPDVLPQRPQNPGA